MLVCVEGYAGLSQVLSTICPSIGLLVQPRRDWSKMGAGLRPFSKLFGSVSYQYLGVSSHLFCKTPLHCSPSLYRFPLRLLFGFPSENISPLVDVTILFRCFFRTHPRMFAGTPSLPNAFSQIHNICGSLHLPLVKFLLPEALTQNLHQTRNAVSRRQLLVET